MMHVSEQVLRGYTGKTRPSAQARFLRKQFPKIIFVFRDDGSLALRQEEFDRYTLSKAAQPAAGQTRRNLDLSLLRRAG